MRNVKIIVGTLTVLLIVVLTALTYRKPNDSLAYTAANQITTVGTVEDVQEFYCPVTDDRGTHVVLKTDSGTMLVHVGISRFLREHQFAIRPGDRLHIAGVKVRYQGKDGMIAREIVRGTEVFTLRDHSGKPLWN